MSERDMVYGGYYQGVPGNMMQYSFGYQGMPGSLMNNGMIPNMMGGYQNPNIVDLNGTSTNYLTELNNRVNNLEKRVNILEQKIGINNSYQDDNSMYMI